MKKYLVRLTDEYLEKEKDEKKRGINRFSLVKNPAIEVKGYFFKEQTRFQDFDNMKMRLATPVMLPATIYRQADDEMEEHEVVFDEEGLTQLFDEFMKTKGTGGLNEEMINVDHKDVIAPAYIREIWQVSDPQNDRSKLEFNMEVPKGAIFAIIQFTDKTYYIEAVKSGRTGVSVEAFFEIKEYQFKKQDKMSRKQFKKRYHFEAQVLSEDGKTVDGENIVIVAENEELTAGASVVVVDENLTPQDNYTGDVVVDGDTVAIVDGKVDGIEKPKEVELEEEKPAEEEAKEEVKKEDVKKEELEEAPTQEVPKEMDVTQIVEQVVSALAPQFEEIYKRVGEIEAKLTQNVEEESKDYQFANQRINLFAKAKRKK